MTGFVVCGGAPSWLKWLYPDMHVIEVLEWPGCAKDLYRYHSRCRQRSPNDSSLQKSPYHHNAINSHHTNIFCECVGTAQVANDFSLPISCNFLCWQTFGEENDLWLLTKCFMVIYWPLLSKLEIPSKCLCSRQISRMQLLNMGNFVRIITQGIAYNFLHVLTGLFK